MTIIKVFENLDEFGKKKKLIQLRILCLDEHKIEKKKKKKDAYEKKTNCFK